MKKIIFAAAMTVLAAPAFATAVCDGTTAHDATVSAASPADFILNNFVQKCSTNVFLDYEENATVAAVGSASKKGKNVFSGSTAGGAVAPTGTQSDTGFADGTESGAAATAALAAATSS